ncbi:hypothetical protein [Herbaspirillum sp. B65]|jgi:hypothetical protein|uniref:hypothetical protein n=1 Tax=Herbaspirillum sp. B65 TaxID=137708 RepID=UPI00131F1580|nr:hypothetical protein [Herbaspirillum sp. B65]
MQTSGESGSGPVFDATQQWVKAESGIAACPAGNEQEIEAALTELAEFKKSNKNYLT